ncbi:MAG: tetratricopeptide repeat protein [Fimbriimonadaceae bacterium]|nr:tetratricopeptide repeat protein [Fimbriimonadaceae bacterium]
MNEEQFQDIVELFDLPGARTEAGASEYRDLVGSTEQESKNYGHLCMKDSDYVGAISHFQRAIEQGGDTDENVSNLGAAYEASGQTSEAYQEFLRARSIKSSGELDIALASLLKQDGRAREGLAELEAAIEREPDSAYLQFRRADLLRSMGHRKVALTAVLGAIALAPEDPFYHEWAGELAVEAGLFEQALVSLQAAIEISPGEAKTLGLAAVAFFGVGKETEAVRAARLGSDLEPDNLVLAYLRHRIETAVNAEPREPGSKTPELEAYDQDRYNRMVRSLGAEWLSK